MQKIKQNEMIYNIISLLTLEANFITKKQRKIGYRERIKIERCLFSLLKCLCNDYLDYNVQGFSQNHRENLNKIMVPKNCEKLFVQTVNQLFQLKIFFKSISSESAYVRGDALSRVGVNSKTVIDFIENQIQSIIKKIKILYVEQ